MVDDDDDDEILSHLHKNKDKNYFFYRHLMSRNKKNKSRRIKSDLSSLKVKTDILELRSYE